MHDIDTVKSTFKCLFLNACLFLSFGWWVGVSEKRKIMFISWGKWGWPLTTNASIILLTGCTPWLSFCHDQAKMNNHNYVCKLMCTNTFCVYTRSSQWT